MSNTAPQLSGPARPAGEPEPVARRPATLPPANEAPGPRQAARPRLREAPKSTRATAPFYARSKRVLVGLVRCSDFAIIVGSALFAYWLRHDSLQFPERYGIALVLGVLLALQVFQAFRLYRFRALEQLTWQLSRLMTAWSLVGLGLIAVVFFTKTAEEFSRVWAATWYLSTWLALVTTRILLKLKLRAWQKRGWLARRVAIIGAGEHGRRLVQHLRRHGGDEGIEVVGVFDDRKTRVPAHRIEAYPILGSIADLIDRCRAGDVDEVFAALPWRADSRLLEISSRLRQVPVNLRLAPESIGFRLTSRPLQEVTGLPMLTMFERPLSGWHHLLKLAEDKLLGSLILLLALPLMLLIAILIRLDSPGPVLFRQQRYGFNNNVITVWKFRTMRHVPAADESNVVQARRDDPRVTRIGALLRRTSLDELPQFFNVLGGSMSIVGPRPHAVAHNLRFAETLQQYCERHRVKPGITGWAQVNGLRGETDTTEKLRLRLEHDLEYIDNWSLWLDLKIIAMTLFVGLAHKHAY